MELIHQSIRRFQNNKTKILYFLYCWAPSILYMGIIFYLSSQSKLPALLKKYPDYILHAVEYFLLNLLLLRGFLMYPIRGSWSALFLISTLIATLFGISDEIHQYFVASRTFSFQDIVADFVGAALAASVVYLGLVLKKPVVGS